MSLEVATQLLMILRQEEKCNLSHSYLSILAAGLAECWAKTSRSDAGRSRLKTVRRKVRG
jgi:hypothetical protein